MTDFAEITSDSEVQEKLRLLYGTVDNIDAWVGALAEDHIPGSSTGPLVRAVVADQFERLRDGDRFWYQRAFRGSTLRELERTSLADVLRRNTTLSNLQENTFFFRVGISGTVFGDRDQDGRLDGREPGLADQEVELINTDTGEVVGSAVSDSRGRYAFDVASGLGLGRYHVQVVLADGQTQTTTSRTLVLTRGETYLRSADLGVASASTGSSATESESADRVPVVAVAPDTIAATASFTTLGRRRIRRGG